MGSKLDSLEVLYQEDSVCRIFRRTAADGRSLPSNIYNLDAVISVGYRATAIRVIQFLQWYT